MTAKKVIIYTALIIGGIFVIKKLTKKEEPEEPFILSQEGGEMQTRPAQKTA